MRCASIEKVMPHGLLVPIMLMKHYEKVKHYEKGWEGVSCERRSDGGDIGTGNWEVGLLGKMSLLGLATMPSSAE